MHAPGRRDERRVRLAHERPRAAVRRRIAPAPPDRPQRRGAVRAPARGRVALDSHKRESRRAGGRRGCGRAEAWRQRRGRRRIWARGSCRSRTRRGRWAWRCDDELEQEVSESPTRAWSHLRDPGAKAQQFPRDEGVSAGKLALGRAPVPTREMRVLLGAPRAFVAPDPCVRPGRELSVPGAGAANVEVLFRLLLRDQVEEEFFAALLAAGRLLCRLLLVFVPAAAQFSQRLDQSLLPQPPPFFYQRKQVSSAPSLLPPPRPFFLTGAAPVAAAPVTLLVTP